LRGNKTPLPLRANAWFSRRFTIPAPLRINAYMYTAMRRSLCACTWFRRRPSAALCCTACASTRFRPRHLFSCAPLCAPARGFWFCYRPAASRRLPACCRRLPLRTPAHYISAYARLQDAPASRMRLFHAAFLHTGRTTLQRRHALLQLHYAPSFCWMGYGSTARAPALAPACHHLPGCHVPGSPAIHWIGPAAVVHCHGFHCWIFTAAVLLFLWMDYGFVTCLTGFLCRTCSPFADLPLPRLTLPPFSLRYLPACHCLVCSAPCRRHCLPRHFRLPAPFRIPATYHLPPAPACLADFTFVSAVCFCRLPILLWISHLRYATARSACLPLPAAFLCLHTIVLVHCVTPAFSAVIRFHDPAAATHGSPTPRSAVLP